MIEICFWGPRDDPVPGPTEPRQAPARAGSPAAHAVPLHARGVSCTPNEVSRAIMGWRRSPVDGRRADPAALGRRRLDFARPGRNELPREARTIAERTATGTRRTANENLVTRAACPRKRQVPSPLLVNLVKDVPHYESADHHAVEGVRSIKAGLARHGEEGVAESEQRNNVPHPSRISHCSRCSFCKSQRRAGLSRGPILHSSTATTLAGIIGAPANGTGATITTASGFWSRQRFVAQRTTGMLAANRRARLCFVMGDVVDSME